MLQQFSLKLRFKVRSLLAHTCGCRYSGVNTDCSFANSVDGILHLPYQAQPNASVQTSFKHSRLLSALLHRDVLLHAASGLRIQAIFRFDGQGVPSIPKLGWKLRQLCVLHRIGMYGIMEGRSTPERDAMPVHVWCRLWGSCVSVEYVWVGSVLCMLERRLKP